MRLKPFKRKKGKKLEDMISERNSEIEEDERAMIQGIFGLAETAVKSIMVPRTDVVTISVDMPLEDILSVVIKSGHSRIPVYENTIDNVIGFLYAKDLLSVVTKEKKEVDLKKILRPVLFVPEGKLLDELLKDFRQKKVHIAVVVDEYGGMAGIVCLENILEEIVGEIQDEYDDEEEEIKRLAPNSYILDARTPIPEINEEIHIDLPEDGSDTVGGFVFNLFGKIPAVNEKISYDRFEFKVEKMEGRKIKKVKMLLRDQEPSHE
jgi:magnesium and cobalt transporter